MGNSDHGIYVYRIESRLIMRDRKGWDTMIAIPATRPSPISNWLRVEGWGFRVQGSGFRV